MRKQLASLLLLLLLFSSLAGGGNQGADKTDYMLDIAVTSWNGWDGSYEPQPEKHSFSVKLRDSIAVPTASPHGLSFKVTGLSQDRITIKTGEPMCIDDGNGIDLESVGSTFTIDSDQPLLLITPTTDELLF